MNIYRRVRVIHVGSSDSLYANCYLVQARWVWWPLWHSIQVCDEKEQALSVYANELNPRAGTKTYVVCESAGIQEEKAGLLRPVE